MSDRNGTEKALDPAMQVFGSVSVALVLNMHNRRVNAQLEVRKTARKQS